MTPPGRLRAVVADDEPLARRFLEDRLWRLGGVEVVASCADGREAVRAVVEHGPDLLFLDIHMPELDGFAVLDELSTGRRLVVVFVTAFDEFAVRAFEVEALDYLLKPFDDERLEATLKRARAALSGRDQGGGGDRRGADDQVVRALTALRAGRDSRRIAVHDGDRVRFVPAWEVDWIEADGKRTRVHVGEEAHLAKQSIGSLEGWLDPARFLRISRSAIVNLDRVFEVQRWFQGQYLVVLRSGAKLTTTRTYRRNLDRLIKPEGERA